MWIMGFWILLLEFALSGSDIARLGALIFQNVFCVSRKSVELICSHHLLKFSQVVDVES